MSFLKIKNHINLHKYVINKLDKINVSNIDLGKIKNYQIKKNNPISIKICEPNLGKRGLYSLLGSKRSKATSKQERQILNFLQYADGSNNINQIAKLINSNISNTKKIYLILKKKKLIK